MKKERIVEMLNESIAYHCDEFGLTKEEVTEPVFYGFLEQYVQDKIRLDDVLFVAEQLEIEVISDNLPRFKELKLQERAKRQLAKQKRTKKEPNGLSGEKEGGKA